MRLTVHVPVLIGLAAACTPSAPRLDWTIDFAEGAPRPPEVMAVRAWIRAGDCESGEPVYSVVLTPSGPMVASPPHLDDGAWAFGADALDAECRTVATACEVLVVPTETVALELELEALDPPSAGCSTPAVCEAGTCLDPFDAGASDAGPRDGGTDAGARDAGARDAGARDGGAHDAGTDAGPADAGISCPSAETECRDGADDDCDGMIDCADPDCTGESCAGGGLCGGGVCCETCVSAAGVCVAAASPAQCGRNGEACVACPDCVDCLATGTCGGTVSAGTACPGGVCIGTTSLTCCTGCVEGSMFTGTCEVGSSATACGSGGDSCVSCGAAEVCTSRNECCGGCTTSTGACRPGDAELNCGTGGVACEACTGAPQCCDAPSGVGGVCGTCA